MITGTQLALYYRQRVWFHEGRSTTGCIFGRWLFLPGRYLCMFIFLTPTCLQALLQQRVLGMTHGPDLDVHALQHSCLYPLVLNIPPREETMRSLELVVLEDLPHAQNLIGTQGYHVGNTPEEAKGVDALGTLSRVPERVDAPVAPPSGCHHQGVGGEEMLVIKQDHCVIFTLLSAIRCHGTSTMGSSKGVRKETTHSSPGNVPPV